MTLQAVSEKLSMTRFRMCVAHRSPCLYNKLTDDFGGQIGV